MIKNIIKISILAVLPLLGLSCSSGSEETIDEEVLESVEESDAEDPEMDPE